jgi:hypothetical protein
MSACSFGKASVVQLSFKLSAWIESWFGFNSMPSQFGILGHAVWGSSWTIGNRWEALQGTSLDLQGLFIGSDERWVLKRFEFVKCCWLEERSQAGGALRLWRFKGLGALVSGSQVCDSILPAENRVQNTWLLPLQSAERLLARKGK